MKRTTRHHDTEEETDHVKIIGRGILLLALAAVCCIVLLIIAVVINAIFIENPNGAYLFLGCLAALVTVYGAGRLEQRYDILDRVEGWIGI